MLYTPREQQGHVFNYGAMHLEDISILKWISRGKGGRKEEEGKEKGDKIRSCLLAQVPIKDLTDRD